MSLLETEFVAKPWGLEYLPPPFAAPPCEKIGEVWFKPPPQLDQLLVKYIFTGENLSIQVHPSDAQLPGSGKDECWLVIAAEPDAKLGVGFHEPITAGALRAAALDGSIEDLLAWIPVAAGDFFSIPAGTVHAIGAGVSLIEVQQNNDVTFRLFDYGRSRQLHLDQGLAVARGEPHHPGLRRHVPLRQNARLVDGPRFRLDQISGMPDPETAARYSGSLLVIPRDGSVRVGGELVKPGQCAVAASLGELEIDGVCLIAQPCRA